LATAARCADCIIETAPQLTPASIVPPPENNDPRKYVEDLRHQVEALHAKLHRVLSNSRNCRSDSRSPSLDVTLTLCWYHRRYGTRAQNLRGCMADNSAFGHCHMVIGVLT
jgi:hypothetical protein